MKLMFSFLSVAAVVGMVSCRPGVSISHTITTTRNFDGSVINVNSTITTNDDFADDTERFPTRWIAEFVDPVEIPNEDVIESLLGLMDNTELWKLKPAFPDRKNYASNWSLRMKLPRYWRVKKIPLSIGQTEGPYALIKLNKKVAGRQYFRQHRGDLEPNSVPVKVKIDYNDSIVLKCSNHKLVVEFSVKCYH